MLEKTQSWCKPPDLMWENADTSLSTKLLSGCALSYPSTLKLTLVKRWGIFGDVPGSQTFKYLF